MSRFKIGQRVVCVKSHSQGIVSKGNIYIIQGVDSCCTSVVSVNDIILPYNMKRDSKCQYCGNQYKGIWVNSNLFAPIELSNTTFEEIAKEFNLEVIHN